jgi:DegV family protein with EDD domain
VLIVVDGACDLSPTIGDRARVIVVPFEVHLGGNAFAGESDELARLLRAKVRLTSSPPGDEAFSAAFGDDREILVVTASTYLSSARDAAATSAKRALADVRIVDSRTFSAGCGLVVDEVLSATDEGASVDELWRLSEMIVETTHTYAIVEHPELLVGHGLLGATKLSRVFRYPVLGVRDRARLLSQSRSRKSAVAWLVHHSREVFGDVPAAWALAHESAENAEDVVAAFRESFRAEPTFVSTMNPTAAIHLGPGAIVVAVRAR